ncbi:hypothetical protein ColKHC_12435 [Colletotrichum higginsianum]|nr:hypothetical protein ColKHC_12435 [Colletotrichum higginsianum]
MHDIAPRSAYGWIPELLDPQPDEAVRGVGLISGRGSGLIMLLHSGPGTGKDFAAETIGEVAKETLDVLDFRQLQ